VITRISARVTGLLAAGLLAWACVACSSHDSASSAGEDPTRFLLADTTIDQVLPDPQGTDSWRKILFRADERTAVVTWQRGRRSGFRVAEFVEVHESEGEAIATFARSAPQLVKFDLFDLDPWAEDLTGSVVAKVGDQQLAVCSNGTVENGCLEWYLYVRVDRVNVVISWSSFGRRPVTELQAMAEALATTIRSRASSG
jgi:hypothetical protein